MFYDLKEQQEDNTIRNKHIKSDDLTSKYPSFELFLQFLNCFCRGLALHIIF